MKRMLAILLIVCSLLSLLVPAASAADTLTDLQRAVVETALAYYYKGGTIQYDSYALASGNRWISNILRQMNNGEPEDASVDDIIYTVCSAFAHDVYYSAFGMHIVDEARWNQTHDSTAFSHLQGMGLDEEALAYELGNLNATAPYTAMGKTWYDTNSATNPGNMVIAYWGPRTENGLEYANTEISTSAMLDVLQPGDVIACIKRTTNDDGSISEASGTHTLVFLGDIFGDDEDYVIHAHGDKYNDYTSDDYARDEDGNVLSGHDRLEACGNQADNENYTRNGAIGVAPFDARFGTGGSDSATGQYSVTILRPLNALAQTDMTDAAKFRLHHPALTIYKTADVKPYNDVMADDTITYTVTFENNTKDTVNQYDIGEGSRSWLGTPKTQGWGAVVKETSRNKTYTDLVLTETLPAGTELVEASGTYSQVGDQLTWTVPSVAPTESTTISYEVKVTGGTQQVVSPKGTVSSGTSGQEGFVQTKELTHEVVSQQVDAAKLPAITDDFVAAFTSSGRSGIDVAEDVYGAAGYDLKLPHAQELVDAIFTEVTFAKESSDRNKTDLQLMEAEDLSSEQAKAWRNMVVPGFVGGARLFTSDENGVRTNKNRLLTLNHQFLQPGDILFYINTASGRDTAVASENAYVYLGSDKFAHYVDGVLTETTDSVVTYYSDKDGNGTIMDSDLGSNTPPTSGARKYSHSKILYQCFLQDLFVVLRPARVGLEEQTASTTANAVEVHSSNGTVTNYASLADAYTAAADGDTIVLQEDVSFSSVQKIEKAITLDLNGYSATSPAKTNDTFRVLNDTTKIAVTIKNGTINGVVCTGKNVSLRLEDITILSPGNYYSPTSVNRYGSALCIGSSSSTVTLKNVSIASKSMEYAPIQYLNQNVVSGNVSSYKKFTVEDNFKVLIPAGMEWDYSTLGLSTGVKAYEGTTQRSFEGNVEPTADSDAYTSVTFTSKPDVENLTKEEKYASLTQALLAMEAGDELRLLQDVDAADFDEAGQMFSSGAVSYFFKPKTMTLDLNGHSIVERFSASASFYLGTGTYTFQNGTILGSPRDGMNNNGTTTLENMTVAAQRHAVYLSSSSTPQVTVDKGSVLVGGLYGLKAGSAVNALAGTATLCGGSGAYSVTTKALSASSGSIVTEDAVIGVGLHNYNYSGLGSFTLAEGIEMAPGHQQKTVALDGKMYSFTADVYAVAERNVSVGDKDYATLAAAMEEAAEGDTVTIKKDLTAAESVTVPAGVTLELGENTLTLDENTTLTVKGTVTGAEVVANAEQVVLEGAGNYMGITIPEGVEGTVHPDLSLDGEYTMAADSVIKITGTVSTTRENVKLMNLTDGGTIAVTDGQFSLGNRVAKQMGDTTRVVLIVEGENATYVGKTQEICVQTTAEQVLKGIDWNDEAQKKAGQALVAMLNYGAQAQTYFGYNDGALVNVNMTQYNPYLKTFELDRTDASALSGKDTSLMYGTSCVLGEELKMKMYFRVPADTTDVTAVLTYKGNTYELSSTNMVLAEDTDAQSDYYSYVLEGLTLTDLDEQVTVVIMQGDVKQATAKETLRSYLARFYALDAKGAAMADAILNYALAVKELS